MYQKTINKEIVISGVGLHTGVITNVNIKPARANTGIIFQNCSTKNNFSIKATIENVYKKFQVKKLEKNLLLIQKNFSYQK